MKQIWSGRVVQAAAKYGEHAPTAAVCCNACRTCVQTNALGLALAAIAAAGGTLTRLARRVTRTA
jgi:NAD/NADP transhydrogenase alpha subunit